MNIEIEEKSIVELFNDLHWFNIPSYQRPYVWTEENISEFLDDITYAFENNISEKYFLGSLVLQKKIGFDYDVLDGQQRLTTIYKFIENEYVIQSDISKDIIEYIIEYER